MDEKHLKMIEDLHSGYTEIRTALLGNDYNEDGLIKRVSKVEEKTERHDLFFKIGTGVATIIGILTAFLSDFFGIFK